VSKRTRIEDRKCGNANFRILRGGHGSDTVMFVNNI